MGSKLMSVLQVVNKCDIIDSGQINHMMIEEEEESDASSSHAQAGRNRIAEGGPPLGN
jgi:hypothetical protein